MNIASMSEPNTISPRTPRPRTWARGDVQVVERVPRAALADDEGDQSGAGRR